MSATRCVVALRIRIYTTLKTTIGSFWLFTKHSRAHTKYTSKQPKWKSLFSYERSKPLDVRIGEQSINCGMCNRSPLPLPTLRRINARSVEQKLNTLTKCTHAWNMIGKPNRNRNWLNLQILMDSLWDTHYTRSTIYSRFCIHNESVCSRAMSNDCVCDFSNGHDYVAFACIYVRQRSEIDSIACKSIYRKGKHKVHAVAVALSIIMLFLNCYRFGMASSSIVDEREMPSRRSKHKL